MNSSRIFKTQRFIAYEGDSHTHRLSLAVQVIDGFTGKRVEASLRVYLKEFRRLRPLLSRSGFYCFEEIPDGNYTLIVEPDPVTADYYFLMPPANAEIKAGVTRPIRLPMPNPLSPLEVVRLTPKSAYPFPANATLTRGRVTKKAEIDGDAPVNAENVRVSARYLQVHPTDSDQTIVGRVETLTDIFGEYVLFYQKLPGKAQQVVVAAVKNGDRIQQETTIIEGSTQHLAIHFP